MEKLEFELSANTDRAKKDLTDFEEDLNATKKRLESKEAFNLAVNVAKIDTEVKKISAQIRKAEKEWDLDAVIQLKADREILKKELTGARRELTNFSRTWKKELSALWTLFGKVGIDVDKFNGKISGVGESLASLWIIAGATILLQKFSQALKLTSNIAVSFESAFAGVAKTIDATDWQLRKIENQLKKLSTQLPLTFEELASLAEVGGQLWVKADDIVKFTETVAKIDATTNLTGEQASTQFAQIASVIWEPISQIDKMASSLVELGNNFETNESKILDFSSRISGAGAIVGLTSAEILGISTAFSSVGIEAEAGGSAVQKALLTINNAVSKWGIELEKFATIAGISGQEFSRIWETDASKGFTLFVEGLGKSGDEASQILGDLIGTDVQLARAFLSVANTSGKLSKAIDVSSKAFDENIALQEEFSKRLDTNASKLKIQQNRWRLWGESIGKNVTPVLIETNDFLLNVLPLSIAGLQNALVVLAVFFAEKWKQITIATKGFSIGLQKIFNDFIGLFSNLGENLDTLGQRFWVVFRNIDVFVKAWLNKALDSIEDFVNKGQRFINKFLGSLWLEKEIPEFKLDFRFNDKDFEEAKGQFKAFNKWNSEEQNKLLDEELKRYTDNKNREIQINRDALKKNISDRNKQAFLIANNEKQARQERKKELEKELKGDLEAVQSYLEKIKELEDKEKDLARSEQLKEERKILEEITQKVREKAKENERAYKSIIGDISDGVDKLDKYIDKVEDINSKYKDLKEDATANIKEISKSLEDLENETPAKLGERYVDILKEEKELREELSNSDIFGTEREAKAQEQLNKLLEEKNLILQNTTTEDLQQAQENADLSETEKILKEAEAQKKVLEERKAIFEAIQNDEKINLEDIKNFENLQLAEQLINKRDALDQELEAVKANIESQREELVNFNNERKQFEKEWTEFFGTQIQKQKGFVKELKEELRDFIALQDRASLSGLKIGTTPTENQREIASSNIDNRRVDVNINASDNVDIDQAVDKISETIR